MAITETDLTKLLSTAESAAKRAEADTADAAEEGRAVDALRVLGQQTITADLLAKTGAGKRVKKLEKHTSKKVASEAAATVAAWKECVRKEQAAASGSGGGASKPREGSQPDSEAPSAGESGSQPANGSTLSKAPSNRLMLDRDPEKSGDETRDRIRKLLKEALAPAVTPDNFGDPCAVAVDVENAMVRPTCLVGLACKRWRPSGTIHSACKALPLARHISVLGTCSTDACCVGASWLYAV
jgi:hypothetical protein